MHQELFQAYQEELRFLREIGDEFAHAHPQTAAALGLHPQTAKDPFVERLLEGVAFLTAKTACRLNNAHERLSQDLIQAVMPDLLCKLAPAAMLEMHPMAALRQGARSILPRGSQLRYNHLPDQALSFMTVSDLELASLELKKISALESSVVSHWIEQVHQRYRIDLPGSVLMVQIELSSLSGQPLTDALPASLKMHCTGPTGAALWHALTHQCNAVLLCDPNSHTLLGVHSQKNCESTGWSDEEALLPNACVMPSPYRLLREWRYWPERFLFAQLNDVAKSICGFKGSQLQIVFCLDGNTRLPKWLPEKSLKLNCVPAVNLKHVACEPIMLSPTENDYALRLPSIYKNHQIVHVDKVAYRSANGLVQNLASAGVSTTSDYFDSCASSYALRQHARWDVQPAHKTVLKQVEWRIAPNLQVPAHAIHPHLLSAHAWISHPDADSLNLSNNSAWLLECAAPVQSIQCVQTPTKRFETPQDPLSLLSLASFRIDLLAREEASKMTAKFKNWLQLFGNDDFSDAIESVELGLCVRPCPHTRQHVLASGWQLILSTNEETALNPLLPVWIRVLAGTLCFQLQSESFFECSCRYDNKVIATARVWK
jgi:type VI secretion system VasI/ImpG family protein